MCNSGKAPPTPGEGFGVGHLLESENFLIKRH